MPDAPFGFLNIDKPPGMTSHDVVNKIRRGLKIKKVGHAGTLDPMATGVLVMCVGKATRLSEYAMASTKRYEARLRLGQITDTYDADGDIIEARPAGHLTRDDLLAVLPKFTGHIEQVPPMYSAIKQGGRKLYELARAGEEVEREARSVKISMIALTDWSPPECTLDVMCSAGTYIRSLAYDIGAALDVGAHLTGLIRTASGDFTLEKAVTLDNLLADADWQRYVLPPQQALGHFPTIQLTAEETVEIRHGRRIESSADKPELAFAYDPAGELVAIVRADGGLWRPHKVFLPA